MPSTSSFTIFTPARKNKPLVQNRKIRYFGGRAGRGVEWVGFESGEKSFCERATRALVGGPRRLYTTRFNRSGKRSTTSENPTLPSSVAHYRAPATKARAPSLATPTGTPKLDTHFAVYPHRQDHFFADSGLRIRLQPGYQMPHSPGGQSPPSLFGHARAMGAGRVDNPASRKKSLAQTMPSTSSFTIFTPARKNDPLVYNRKI